VKWVLVSCVGFADSGSLKGMLQPDLASRFFSLPFQKLDVSLLRMKLIYRKFWDEIDLIFPGCSAIWS